MTLDRVIELWSGRDQGGTRTLWLRPAPGGGLLIEGQDLGPGVSGAFGSEFSEYEWAWTMAADDVPHAVELLGGEHGGDIVALLKQWVARYPGQDPGLALKNLGGRLTFWSRLGE